jgi:hypothetical protein
VNQFFDKGGRRDDALGRRHEKANNGDGWCANNGNRRRHREHRVDVDDVIVVGAFDVNSLFAVVVVPDKIVVFVAEVQKGVAMRDLMMVTVGIRALVQMLRRRQRAETDSGGEHERKRTDGQHRSHRMRVTKPAAMTAQPKSVS